MMPWNILSENYIQEFHKQFSKIKTNTILIFLVKFVTIMQFYFKNFKKFTLPFRYTKIYDFHIALQNTSPLHLGLVFWPVWLG